MAEAEAASPAEQRPFVRRKFVEEFTFHPKISQNSQRITESLGTDFYERQMRHLHKQQQLQQQQQESRKISLSYSMTSASEEAALPEREKESQQKSSESKKSTRQSRPTPSGGGGGESVRPAAALKRRSRSMPPAAAAARNGGGLMTRDTRSRAMSPQPTAGVSMATAKAEYDARLARAREMADSAAQKNRVFAICGPYPHIRHCLRQRGWVEKFEALAGDESGLAPWERRRRQTGEKEGEEAEGGDGNKVQPWEEQDGLFAIVSRMVRSHPPDFYWTLRKDQVEFKNLRKEQLVNHHAKAGCFTTKSGLCQTLRQLPWFGSQTADTFFPRCYVLSNAEDRLEFVEDFRQTACASLVKFVAEQAKEKSKTSGGSKTSGESKTSGSTPADAAVATDRSAKTEAKPTDAGGKNQKGDKNVEKVAPSILYEAPSAADEIVGSDILELAMRQCQTLLTDKEDEDLDGKIQQETVTDTEWEKFLEAFYRVAHYGASITHSASHASTCQSLCQQLRSRLPQFDIDGFVNAWIVKPGAKSRGRGIFCVRTLNAAMETGADSTAQCVVQKYIERPLLVHDTKFDIRQWFLVTDFNPLTIWWYKQCYIRFCSQTFTLNDFNEAVHLSNNSIQYKYLNQESRHPDLPDDNIWDSCTFKNFLADSGKPDVFDDVIVPGMKQAVISAMQCSQDSVDVRKNCFELYGADFMIDDWYRPWLIEINSSPTMAPSTEVTTRMCRCVQEDVLKVILDCACGSQSGCDSGNFELAIRQQAVPLPNYAGIDLTLQGRQLLRRRRVAGGEIRPGLMAEERRLDRQVHVTQQQQQQQQQKQQAASVKSKAPGQVDLVRIGGNKQRQAPSYARSDMSERHSKLLAAYGVKDRMSLPPVTQC